MRCFARMVVFFDILETRQRMMGLSRGKYYLCGKSVKQNYNEICVPKADLTFKRVFGERPDAGKFARRSEDQFRESRIGIIRKNCIFVV